MTGSAERVLMPPTDGLRLFLYLAALVSPTPLLGRFMARVLCGDRTFLSPVLLLDDLQRILEMLGLPSEGA